MKRLLILFTMLSLFLFMGCGMLGFGEPDVPEETPAVTDPASTAAGGQTAPSIEESEAIKDEQHRQEIEAQEEEIEALIAEQKQVVPKEQTEAETLPELSADDLTTLSNVPSKDETLTETEDQAQNQKQEKTFLEGLFGSDEENTEAAETAEEHESSFLGGLFGLDNEEPETTEEAENKESNLLGGLFGSDEEEPQKSKSAVITEESKPVDEPREEEPSTWSKIQGFFINEKPSDEETAETLAITSPEPPGESPLVLDLDLCSKAPSLIEDMHERLLKLKTLTDPRLRDPKNDVLFPTIFFDFDQSLIKEDGNQRLQNQTPCILEELEKNENLVVQVEGHADERGNDEYNIALGYRRANAVLGVIKVYVTDTAKIQTISYGEEFPAVQGSNPEAWAKNRRVVFTLLLKSQ